VKRQLPAAPEPHIIGVDKTSHSHRARQVKALPPA